MLAFAVIGLIFFVLLAVFSSGYLGLLAVPVVLATVFVVSRHVHPLLAALLGTAITFGLIFGMIFPVIVIKAIQGDFDNTAYCDGFCFTNGEGFLFATFLLLFVAVPTSLASGAISFIASLVTPRLPRSA